MSAVTFDTLKFSNRLKQAGVPDKQAEAEAEVLAEALQVNLRDLVTRADLSARIDALEAKISARIDALEAKVSSDIRDLESRSRARVDTLEVKVSGELTLIKWMLGLVVGGVLALILKAFF